MMTMAGAERYEATLDGRVADCLPRIPVLMRFAAEWIGASYEAFCRDYRVKVEANIRCAERFGLDVVGVMSDPFSEAEGFGAQLIYHDQQVPSCPRPPLASTKDLARLPRPRPHDCERMANTIRAVASYRERVGEGYCILGWVEGAAAEASNLRGCEVFLVDLVDDPDWAGAAMDRCLAVAVDYARAQVDAGATTVGIGDAIASQVSPAMYRRQIRPRQQRLAEAIRGMGARVRLHVCGDITHLLPEMAGLPIDILDVDHAVRMTDARAAMPADVALAGNLDPVADVMQGTPESIRTRLRRIYESVGDPFLVNAGCEIPPGTPPANLEALCERIPRHG